MNISLNSIRQSHLLHIQRINQGLAKQGGFEKSARAERRDIVSISPQGRASNLLEKLIKQKLSITDQKNSLIGSTLEKGGSLDTIKSQMEAYEEQLKAIDSQITDLMAKQAERQGTKPKRSDLFKTEEEQQNAALEKLAFGISTDFKQAKTIHSVKSRLDGDARVLRSEIATDKSRSGSTAYKEAQLAEMEKKSLRLGSQLSDRLAGLSESAAEEGTVIPQPPVTRPIEEQNKDKEMKE